jgi:hypothetical protein
MPITGSLKQKRSPKFKKCTNLSVQFQAISRLTFPYSKNSIAHARELTACSSVTSPVCFKFIEPERAVLLRSCCLLARFVSMPKATMNKDCPSTLYGRKVGRSGQISAVFLVSLCSAFAHHRTNQDFGRSSRLAHSAHSRRAFGRDFQGFLPFSPH